MRYITLKFILKTKLGLIQILTLLLFTNRLINLPPNSHLSLSLFHKIQGFTKLLKLNQERRMSPSKNSCKSI